MTDLAATYADADTVHEVSICKKHEFMDSFNHEFMKR
jgi:hypothetical protein